MQPNRRKDFSRSDMPTAKPTIRQLIVETLLEAVELTGFFTVLGLAVLVVVAIGAVALGTPLQTLRAVAEQTVDLHRMNLVAGAAAVLAFNLLFAALRGVWRRWPIFE